MKAKPKKKELVRLVYGKAELLVDPEQFEYQRDSVYEGDRFVGIRHEIKAMTLAKAE